MKLAEALLRRKQLNMKVQQLHAVKQADIYEDVISRVKVSDSYDNVTGKVAKLELNQVTAEYDYYAQQLRKIDAVIQQANWSMDVNCDECMGDFKQKK